jgi:hypothetical protein
MNAKTKRTYNLSVETVAHVRDLASRGGDLRRSQDGIVEMAVEQLYREVRDKEEAALWARASEDSEFQAEMKSLSLAYRDRDLEAWPAS